MFHINMLEFRVIHLSLILFLPHIWNRVMHVLMDTITPVHYLNEEEGICSSHVWREISLWEWCILHSIYSVTLHVAGEYSEFEDQLRRHLTLLHECSLKKLVIHDKFSFSSWDLNLVLIQLMTPPFEPVSNWLLFPLSSKLSFIIAIVSVRRIVELHALIADPIYCIS